jgi:hypothetical protein
MRRMTKPRSFAPIIAAVLLLLPVLYVGSYFAMIVPRGSWTAIISSTCPVPRYRVGGVWLERFFWPLEQIDRKLRPRAWEADDTRFIEKPQVCRHVQSYPAL